MEDAWALHFPLCEDVHNNQHAHPDASLAPPTQEWASLKDIMPAYLHRPALQIWMDKKREQNITGETSWPWAPWFLSETNWSLWKVLCIAKKGETGALTFNEEGSNVLY